MIKEKILQELESSETLVELWSTFESVCSLKLRSPALVWGGGFSFGAASSFVDEWIISPPVTYIALIALIAFDHVSGVTLAFKNDRFETKKALRIFWTLISHTALLMLSNALSKGSSALFWLNEAVFVPLVLVNLLSLVKNLSLLGYIKKGFAAFFYKKIDKYKNEFAEKEFKKDEDKD